MIKSVNQLVNYACNSRCRMCLIWALGEDKNKMTPDEFRKLYSRSEFRTVEDLCISGGEPTLRDDLEEIMDAILQNLPYLRMLFLSTNCTFPYRVIKFLDKTSLRVQGVYAVIPLEGDRETHRTLRGMDSYDRTVELLEEIKIIYNPRVRSIISMTLQPENCNYHSIEHVRKIAQEKNSGFTFRPAGRSSVFYANSKIPNIDLSDDQIDFLRSYLVHYEKKDPFLHQLERHLSGEETVMGNRDSGIRCLAGKIAVFIQSDGTIYPCIYSTRIIGDKENGLYHKPFTLGDKEPCPCCTECQIYPMINYGGKNG